MNLLVGALAMAWLKVAPPISGAPRFLLFLTAAVHLFTGAGYLMVDPIFGFGDWGRFIEGLTPLWAWRLGLSVLGLLLSVAALQLLRGELDVFLGPGNEEQRRPIAQWLCLGPYLAAGGALMTLGAAFNELGIVFAGTSALATLGGTAWLAWLPLFVHERPGGSPAIPVVRSGIWITLGITAVLFELFAFGPGIRWV
jgi:hypothetical protein